MSSRPSRPLTFLLFPGLVAFALAGCVIPSRSDPPELSRPDLKCADTDGLRDVTVTVTPGPPVRTAGADEPLDEPPVQDEPLVLSQDKSDVTGAAIPFTPIPGIADVVEQLWEIDEIAPEGGTTGEQARIRVVRSDDHGTTRWIVLVPSAWPWISPQNLDDNATCLGEPGGERSPTQTAVTKAVQLAGVGPDEPVMLAGYSLGGLTAARLVADPSFADSYQVTALLTAGAPIARLSLEGNVQILSVEHREDHVIQRDGRDNPDQPNWTTVTNNTPDLSYLENGPTDPHNVLAYVVTALEVQEFDHGSVEHYRTFVQPFFDGDQTAADFYAVAAP